MANNFILPISTQTAASGRVGVVKIGTVSSTGIDAQSDGTLFLANTGVAAGTYLKTSVDAMGRVTSGSNADIVVSNTAKVTGATTMAGGADSTKVLTVQDSSNTAMFTVAQTGLTVIKTNVTKAAGTTTDEAFRIESSDNLALFQVMTNGDAKIAGVITVSGTGTSTFAGDVAIGGRLTVAEGIQGSGASATLSAEDFTVNGKLIVRGNTELGDEANIDTTTVRGYTKIVTKNVWHADPAIDANLEVFRIETSDAHQLFQIMGNGDAKFAGVLTVSGTGQSHFAGGLDIDGDVNIGGNLTVAGNATASADLSGNNLTLTGNLIVQGNTTLGDNSGADITTINGITIITSPTTKAAGSNAGTAFLIKSSDSIDLFRVSTNGDATIAGKLTINGGGSASNMTGDFTVTGNLSVQGNTTLGDNAANDTTTINGLTTVVSKATKVGGSSVNNAFLVRSSDSQDLLAVKENGDTVIGGKLTINGSSASSMNGDLNVTGNLTVTGSTILNGNVTFGDSTSDVIKSSAPLNMQNNAIINLASPSNSTDAATKGYVDAAIQGLDIKQSVKWATCNNLVGTYAAGVLTSSVNAALPNLDGTPTPAYQIGDRVLIKDQADQKQNGIYTIFNLGSGSTKWVLQRATDFNSNSNATSGSFVFVEAGTKNSDTGWVMITDNAILDTSNIIWSQFAGAGSVTAGTGTTVIGNQVNLAPATSNTLGGIIASDTTNTSIDASGNLTIKADSGNTSNYIVRRDASGNIYVGTVNASAVNSIGIVSGTNITASGTLGVTGATTLTGTLSANGGITTTTLSTTGNVTLGDATSDSITLTGKIAKVSNVSVAGNFGVQAVGANAADMVIGTTTTTVATFSPSTNGNYIVYLYIRMVNQTTLTVDITFNDGAAQTLNILSDTQQVGSYSIPPIFIYAKTGTPIAISARAGATTSAYVSANIAGF